jgi:hypothetical protein
VALGVNHFKGLFKELDQIKMDAMLKQIIFFLRLIDEEENDDQYREISKEELQGGLVSFRKDKSRRPDGWTAKLFEHFFDIVGDILLQFVKEV